MFSARFTAVVTALFAAKTNAQVTFSPGVKSGIAISVIDQGKNAYFNAVMAKINGL